MARQTGRVIQKIECQAKTAGYQAGIRHVYLEGQYDFVEIIDAPGPETVLGFTIWYNKKGFGTMQSLLAFGDKTIQEIKKRINIEIAGIELLEVNNGQSYTYDIDANTNYNSFGEI